MAKKARKKKNTNIPEIDGCIIFEIEYADEPSVYEVPTFLSRPVQIRTKTKKATRKKK